MEIREIYCDYCNRDRLHHQIKEGSQTFRCMSCGTLRLDQEAQLRNVILRLSKNEGVEEDAR